MGHGSWVSGSWVTSQMGQMGHGSQILTHCQLCGGSAAEGSCREIPNIIRDQYGAIGALFSWGVV